MTDWIDYLSSQPVPTALLVEGAHFDVNFIELGIVEYACQSRGFQVITLPLNDATWANFTYYINHYEPTVLYMTTHGHYEIRNGKDCQPGLLPQVSQFFLKDAVVYAYRPQDGSGNYYPEYPAPGHDVYHYIPVDPPRLWSHKKAHYVSELGLMNYSPLRLVWTDSCFDGRIGALPGDLANEDNPYAIGSGNDLATEFGIWENAWTIGASYCGNFEFAAKDMRYVDFLARVFGSMRVGYSLDQAITRDAWNEPQHRAPYPNGIDMHYGPSPGFPTNGVPNPCTGGL